MELLIVRHGQSEADLLGVHEGRADFPLTKLGEQQAIVMSTYVAEHFPPDLILASPLLRAKSTAETLQKFVGCDLLLEKDLMEFNNGVLAGLSREEARVKYPLPPSGRPIHIPIELGESALEFRFRAEKIFHQILLDYQSYNRVAIVSHGGLISHFINAFLKQPNTSEYEFATGDTGIHLLDIKENKRIIKFLNRQEHLKRC
ncbi:2,3-bisphosphoglycerate-dependent phosphoglycerate mutase [Psychrobacillus sp. OK028]|uniref:histidine phosphatase family protein n=1 Tax=Psychrobacillus sp. OK028 TaxID=1884359 RepID=UPI0008894E77|nr:histidine phosphatase family protein [Psychrobacillus sp. OK028]SDN59613.1 2,3-bisphosphoglycerate-dependent phosphoglycerate mutase [Psychrobacillus sp. OK028]